MESDAHLKTQTVCDVRGHRDAESGISLYKGIFYKTSLEFLDFL